MNYGYAIRVCRAIRGLSQTSLAKLASLDASYISLLENKNRMPSPSTISALAAALDIPLDLINLLAAGENELHAIGPDEAKVLSRHLLDLVVQGSQ